MYTEGDIGLAAVDSIAKGVSLYVCKNFVCKKFATHKALCERANDNRVRPDPL